MKNILIVDDSKFMRAILKDILESKGFHSTFEIHEANSKDEALTLFHKKRPSLILLDIVMHTSKIEGIEFLRCVKEYLTNVKILIISSIHRHLLEQHFADLKIDGYIDKPFHKNYILETINSLLSYDRTVTC